MADLDRSERIKQSVKNNGGYEAVSDITGINSRTLKRMASGETEPKFKDIIAISQATGLSCDFFAFGSSRLNFDRIKAEGKHSAVNMMQDDGMRNLSKAMLSIISESVQVAEEHNAIPPSEEFDFMKTMLNVINSAVQQAKEIEKLENDSNKSK